jgi:hypothetical protein
VKSSAKLYETIAASHPSLLRGRVWCVKCGTFKDIEPARCLREGWPKCHGATMSIEPAPVPQDKHHD